MVLAGSWQGQLLWHPEIGALNRAEILHLDVIKAANGNVRHWKGRLTPLGRALKHHLEKTR